MALRFGGSGVGLPINQVGTNTVVLDQGGQTMLLPPGSWAVQTDGVANFQVLDPIMQVWVPVGPPTVAGNNNTPALQIDSDGVNFRFANNTNLAVAAALTAGGSGYTSAPTVTSSEGNATWRAIVGGAVTGMSLATGGSGYTYYPTILIAPPGPGGVPAVARVTAITGGVISGVTFMQNGAGYAAPPSVTFLNDPRDTTGRGAVATTTLGGVGQVTAILCVDPGYVQNVSGTVPTLTFTGGGGSGAAATAQMNWIVTGFSIVSGGAGYVGTNAIVNVSGRGNTLGVNPFLNQGVQGMRTRPGQYEFPITAGALAGTANPIQYAVVAGLASGNLYVIADSPAGPTTRAILNLLVGGIPSAVYFQTTQA